MVAAAAVLRATQSERDTETDGEREGQTEIEREKVEEIPRVLSY